MNRNCQQSKPSPRTITSPEGASLYYKEEGMTIRLDENEAKLFLKDFQTPEDFQAPETVHIEIEGECNLDCPYCYVPREKDGQVMDSGTLLKLFNQLNDMGVFQLTFGGGEPFLRKDIIPLARAVDKLGMNVTVTTNGTLLENFTAEELSVFRQINISYHREEFRPGFSMQRALEDLKEKEVLAGINFVASKQNLPALPDMAKLAKDVGAVLLLLSYKPVAGDVENVVSLKQIRAMAGFLVKQGVKVAVDSMLSGTCHQSTRLASISASGEVHPCSFIRESLGNVKETPFSVIWQKRRKTEPCPWLSQPVL
jgi:mycofactocin biosynthetic radical S-adenosylmethionine protein MftC